MAKVKFEISQGKNLDTGQDEKMIVAEAPDGQRVCVAASERFDHLAGKMLELQNKMGNAVTSRIDSGWLAAHAKIKDIPNAHAKMSFEAELDLKTKPALEDHLK